MLTKIEVLGVDPSPTLLSLPVSGALGTDPIQMQGADGLGPVKADISTQSYAGIDGAAYGGSSIGFRNIVLKLGLVPNWKDNTMESLRQLLYTYFMPKTNVRLRFTSTHLPVCAIFGYVESMEPDMFSKDPQINVSIICPEPDFVAVDSTVVDGVVDAGQVDVDYVGTRPTGGDLVIRNSGASYTGGLSVILETVSQRVFFITALTLDNNGYVYVGSVPGSKEVLREGSSPAFETNLLPAVHLDQNDWPTLLKGLNKMSVISSAPPKPLDWEFTYFARFGGL